MKKIAIFASGSGSNAENIVKYFKDSQTTEVSVILTNNSKAFVIERAKRLGIECITVTNKEFREADNIIKMMKDRDIELIVLAGFLLLVPEKIIEAYNGQIINIHPALLPKHGGKGMYGDKVHEEVVACKDKISGITIHIIDKEYDCGKTIFQATCPVLPEDTPQDVANKVHELEYQYFPEIIDKILNQTL